MNFYVIPGRALPLPLPSSRRMEGKEKMWWEARGKMTSKWCLGGLGIGKRRENEPSSVEEGK